MTKLSEYVKTAEAAEILGVAQNTIRNGEEQEHAKLLRVKSDLLTGRVPVPETIAAGAAP